MKFSVHPGDEKEYGRKNEGNTNAAGNEITPMGSLLTGAKIRLRGGLHHFEANSGGMSKKREKQKTDTAFTGRKRHMSRLGGVGLWGGGGCGGGGGGVGGCLRLGGGGGGGVMGIWFGS